MLKLGLLIATLTLCVKSFAMPLAIDLQKINDFEQQLGRSLTEEEVSALTQVRFDQSEQDKKTKVVSVYCAAIEGSAFIST